MNPAGARAAGLAAAALLACGCGPAAAEDPAQPLRLFAEAEDFTVERGAWRVVPWRESLFASTFAITFLSRKACLGAPAEVQEPAVAVQAVDLPFAGEFQALVRYAQPWRFSAEFRLEVEQRGRTLLRSELGRTSDPRIWGFSFGAETPMARFHWGSTDGLVWQRAGRVRLEAGAATLRLVAGPQPQGGAGRLRVAERQVDVVVLTSDDAGIQAQTKSRYLPLDGWLVQDGDLFARFTNPRDARGPVVPVVEGFERGQHSPYYVHVRDWPRTWVTRDGRFVEESRYRIAGPRSAAVAAPRLAPVVERPAGWQPGASDALAPGETSDWVPLGNVVDALNDSLWLPRAISPGGDAGDVDLEIELATPDGSGGLRPFRRLRLTGRPDYLSPVGLLIPADVGSARQVRTQLEVLDGLAQAVEAFPKRGRAPRRFPVHGILGFSGALEQAGPLGEAARRLAVALGGREPGSQGRWRIVTHWPVEQVEERLAAARKAGSADDIAVVSYGDEIRIPDGALQRYVAATRLLERELPGVRTGMNYAPHPNYVVDATHFVRPFRERALTLPWSEDYVWQVPELSVQVTGYLVSGLRAGARAHDLPILMYVMPHSPGNTPRSFRLSFYSAVAHGARLLHLFCASPQAVAYTENYIADDDLGMWRAVHDAVHDAGVFEDYVLDGRVRPARVALLLSFEDERRTGDTHKEGGIHNQERKAIYYALRHAQVPVDFVAEDDFAAGRVGPFDLVYVTQQWLHSRTVAALARFVTGGGTVVAMAGGGFLDENDRKNPAAGALYGVADQSLFKDPAVPQVLAKQDLPGLEPLDRIRMGDIEFPALVWKQALLPSNGKVLAQFSDGTPAVVEKRAGRGRAVLFAFLPGLAYLQSGLPLRPVDRGATDAGFNHFLPASMDERIRAVLVDPYLPADFVRPVETSQPLVEATLIETRRPRRLAVPLMNFSGRPLESVSVTLNGLGPLASVRSVERGALNAQASGGSLLVTLPLDVADMLLFEGEPRSTPP